MQVLRIDLWIDRFNEMMLVFTVAAFDGPPVRHPSFTIPPQSRRHSARSGYLASPASSPMLTGGGATSTPSFRLQKEQRPSWNYRISSNGRVAA